MKIITIRPENALNRLFFDSQPPIIACGLDAIVHLVHLQAGQGNMI
jgi:hypothetical protein